VEQCRKTRTCFACGATNGLVRKTGTSSLKISHDKFKAFNMSTSMKKEPPLSKVLFDESFTTVRKSNPEVEKHIKKALDDLNPLRVLKLFRRVKSSDCELLGIRSGRPEYFLWQHVPAPPVCIRPSVGQEGASTEDDITAKLGDIVFANAALKESLNKGQAANQIVELWDHLSLQIAMYINSDVPGLQKGEFGKQIRGFVQRLKGKQGRFRGNLSGKRVDFSGRTVISPDPNLNIDEVAIPVIVAKNLTYPELVTRYNRQKLQECVKNGTRKWPGANYVYKAGQDFRLFLKYGNRDHIATELSEGDTVERHLKDGDVVLFNRQPSLHKLSILSHFVRVRPHRTFRLNECVCNPYNADFDGDEMNLHVPQTEEARTEAVQLMGVKHNIVTPKNGEPIISAIQDFVTASYLLSSKDIFYDKKTFVTICLGMLEEKTKFDLPPPAIIKPQSLWTGKQVFNVLMRPNRRSEVKVNIDAQCRDFKQYHTGKMAHRDLQDDSFLCIRNSEIMCGRMDKSTVGAGRKNSLFYVLYRDFGPTAAAEGMNRLSKLCARWLSNQGFSVGVSDVTPSLALATMKNNMIEKVFRECQEFVNSSKEGKLKRNAGSTDAETLEQEQVKALSTVRTGISGELSSQLSKFNSPMVMATSGSKGSTINVAQMAALLGQQDIEGKRVANGFQDRTLPHFAKHEHKPPSKGFVSNSFYTGLNPSEFLFHAVGGRVGLVDTAVKTAETGYMSRRLMKSLEDLSTQYDHTVRNAVSNVVQFRFGDDELDPVDMEASAKPVDFERTFAHVEATTFNVHDEGLDEKDIHSCMEEILARKRADHRRLDLRGQELPYDNADERFTDQHESARAFIQSINDFVNDKIKAYGLLRADKAHLAVAKASTSRTVPSSSLQPKAAAIPPPKSTRRSLRSSGPSIGDDDIDSTLKPQPGRNKKTQARPTASQLKRGHSAPSTKDRFELTSKISRRTLQDFVKLCLEKYEKARVEPGHAVGAVGAQSIGEPGTQMTLKTFHFAGVAGMSMTQGVPRIKEIINASKDISTPVITCRLERRSDHSIPESLGRIVKGRIESLFLEDITSHIETNWSQSHAGNITIWISLDTIAELGLDVELEDILSKVEKHRRCKDPLLAIYAVKPNRIVVSLDTTFSKDKKPNASKRDTLSPKDGFLRLQHLRRFLPGIHILGHPQATRAVVMAEDDPDSAEIRARRREKELRQVVKGEGQESLDVVTEPAPAVKPGKSDDAVQAEDDAGRSLKTRGKKSTRKAVADEPAIKIEEEEALVTTKPDPEKPIQMHRVMVEGYGLRYCMNTDGVDPYKTSTNSIIETLQVLGIEAARTKIITEIQEVMKDLSIDPRHTALLADVMTYKGEVLGITRFGLAKMRDSVLQLASFEKTADHVFDAGIASKADKIEGVSECVIVGKTMGMGTGSIEVVRNMMWQRRDAHKLPTAFDDCWAALHDKKKRR
jgi:DNA-directed RNA polymerase III subunit RPC1